MPVIPLQDDEKKIERQLIVGLSFHEHSGNFFITFEEPGGCCLPAVKITEQQAIYYSDQWGVKIIA